MEHIIKKITQLKWQKKQKKTMLTKMEWASELLEEYLVLLVHSNFCEKVLKTQENFSIANELLLLYIKVQK